MRKGFDSLAVLVQEALKKDPFSGRLALAGTHLEACNCGLKKCRNPHQI
jgi:hypothetical protein